MEEEAGRAFDLSRDLPIRAALFRTAADAHVLVLTLHHVAADGWSLDIVRRELQRRAQTGVVASAARRPCGRPGGQRRSGSDRLDNGSPKAA